MCDGHHYTKTNTRDNRGRDCKVVGFTTTCAISAYHHYGLYLNHVHTKWGFSVNKKICWLYLDHTRT
jgi:hypothetical protein